MEDGTARARILAAGAELLASGGREALTTRAVAAAAGVQAPTIYRLFGDKRGLLDAVAEQGMTRFIATKQAHAPLEDPLADLRAGWDFTIEFGLAHPAIFAITSDPEHVSPVAERGYDILRARVRRVAQAGRLRVPEERAVQMIRAAGVGTVLVLLAVPRTERDAGLSAANRESVMAAITTEETAGHAGPAAAAIALRASLDRVTLSPGERALLGELLDRIARDA